MIASYNKKIIDTHKQIASHSCIPSAVEMVLKMNAKVEPEYYKLQEEWNNRRDGSFALFDGRALFGLRFARKYDHPRGDTFPINEMFSFISNELKAERYVIVSLPSPGGWHMAVIYDENDDDFVAFTKLRESNASETAELRGIKASIRAIKGTDILVYEKMDTV